MAALRVQLPSPGTTLHRDGRRTAADTNTRPAPLLIVMAPCRARKAAVETHPLREHRTCDDSLVLPPLARERNYHMALQAFIDHPVPGPPRDYVGYGRHIPTVHWPNNAWVAINLVLNYEEGSEWHCQFNGCVTKSLPLEGHLGGFFGSALPWEGQKCPQNGVGIPFGDCVLQIFALS